MIAIYSYPKQNPFVCYDKIEQSLVHFKKGHYGLEKRFSYVEWNNWFVQWRLNVRMRKKLIFFCEKFYRKFLKEF